MTIPNSIQEFVRQRANFQCEYCHYPEFLSTSPLTIDHIMPQSLGGSDKVDNLALACRRCNERHYNFTVGIDPETQQEVPLFNPRQQQWSEHFIWTQTVSKLSALHPQVEPLVIDSISMMNVALIVSSKNPGNFGCKGVGIPQNKTHVRVE